MLKLPCSHPTSIKTHFHLNKNRSLLLCTILPYSKLSWSQPCLSPLCLSLCSLLTTLIKKKFTIVHTEDHNSNEHGHSFHLFKSFILQNTKTLLSSCSDHHRNKHEHWWVIGLSEGQEIGVIANKALTDWYNVKASFCISDPAKCNRWGWVTVGGGASPRMVSEHRWSEIDVAPRASKWDWGWALKTEPTSPKKVNYRESFYSQTTDLLTTS